MPQTDKTPAPRKGFDPGWLMLVAAALLLGRVAFGIWEKDHPRTPGEVLKWVPIAQAANVSRQSGKPILYDFSADWCQPCQMLKREVFSDEKRARALEAVVVPVRVIDRQQEEGRNPPEIEELQRRFAIDGFPSLVVVDPASGRKEMSVGFMGGDATVEWVAKSAMAVRLGVNANGQPHP